MYDLVIKNGTVVTAGATVKADVAVNGEEIAAVGLNLAGRREIDAAGKLVAPGAIDIHVHLEMPIGKFRSTDDFFGGTRAAAFGGTTAIVDFIEPKPAQSMLDALAERRALADPQVTIDYGLHMTIGPQEMEKLAQLPETVAAGCATFKLYMAYGLRLSDGQLMTALEAIRDAGGRPVVHAENWDVICALVERNLAQGRSDPPWHPRSRPALMEAEAVGRIIDLARLVGLPAHIFHVSCQAAAERIAAARRQGLPVTGETCPQYLFLTEEAYAAPGVEGALPICSPPLRTPHDQQALWRALGRGDLQMATTDHCPFTIEEKESGLGDFSQVPGGVPSIEMRFAALYDGVRQGRLTLNQWVDICCAAPARLAGFSRKGEIAAGYDADLVLFDPDLTVTLSPETLHETAGWTPYEGIQLTGWPVMTISRGRIIVEDGQFKGEPGYGRYVVRQV